MTKLVLPPGPSFPANAIKYIHCPFCGAPNAKGLESYAPQLINEGAGSCVICSNPACGAAAPPFTWNMRWHPLQVVK